MGHSTCKLLVVVTGTVTTEICEFMQQQDLPSLKRPRLDN